MLAGVTEPLVVCGHTHHQFVLEAGGRRVVNAGAVGLTLATVAEAEVFAAEGFTDIFIAYPLWVDAAKAARLRALLDTCTVRDTRGREIAAACGQLAADG